MQIEILQNPWLYELMALCINIRESKFKSDKATASSSEGIDLIFSDGKPSLTCGIFDFAKLDIDLTFDLPRCFTHTHTTHTIVRYPKTKFKPDFQNFLLHKCER
jgi:hypothetical protein